LTSDCVFALPNAVTHKSTTSRYLLRTLNPRALKFSINLRKKERKTQQKQSKAMQNKSKRSEAKQNKAMLPDESKRKTFAFVIYKKEDKKKCV